MTSVTIEYQEPRKPYAWKTGFRARVLYADKRLIVVRGAGSESLFSGSGEMRLFGYNPTKTKAPILHNRDRRGHVRAARWRISPKSIQRLGTA